MSENGEKKVMVRGEAEEKLKEWGELLDRNTEQSSFSDAMAELVIPVIRGRLDFDKESGTFTYLLIKPIQHTNSKKEMITISEGNFGSNKVADRIREAYKVEQAEALLARRTGLMNTEVSMLCDRDVNAINAVILGFFGPTKSSE